MRARVDAALRGLYPGLTEGLNEQQALGAVVRQWVSDALVQYEAAQAMPNLTEILDKAREDALKGQRAADAKARKDAEADILIQENS